MQFKLLSGLDNFLTGGTSMRALHPACQTNNPSINGHNNDTKSRKTCKLHVNRFFMHVKIKKLT